MINEEKVLLMTRASLYEQKAGKKQLKIARYFRHDYISLQLLGGWFFATVSFFLCAALWGICRMEYLLDNIHKMDLKSFGLRALILYVMLIAVYSGILYCVCSHRYHLAKKSVGSYAQTLRKISKVYEQEAKGSSAGSMTEET